MNQQTAIDTKIYGALENAVKGEEPDLPAYFESVRACEQAGPPPVAFYKELLDIFERNKDQVANNRLLALEKQRADYILARARAKSETHLEANRKGVNWLDVCRDLKNPDHALFFLFSGRDREEEIRREIYSPEAGPLRAFYRTGLGRIYIPDLISFFLRVYNLPEAWRLAVKLLCAPPPRENDKKPRSPAWRIYAVIMLWPLVSVPLLLLALKYPLFDLGKLPRDLAAWPPFAEKWPGVDGGVTALAVIYILFAAWLLLVLLSRLQIFFRLFLPRLLGGIVVGYMFLIFSNDVWNMIARLNDAANRIVVILLAITFALFFLLNEARQTIRQARVALARSVLVLMIGILEAFVVGFVLSDLFGAGMAPILGPVIADLPGLFGKLYPRFILISAPLALLIGIFVQLIWEDKPITEPF